MHAFKNDMFIIIIRKIIILYIIFLIPKVAPQKKVINYLK